MAERAGAREQEKNFPKESACQRDFAAFLEPNGISGGNHNPWKPFPLGWPNSSVVLGGDQSVCSIPGRNGWYRFREAIPMSLPTGMETQSSSCNWKSSSLRAHSQLGSVTTPRVSVVTLPGDNPAGEPAMGRWCAGATRMGHGGRVCPQQAQFGQMTLVHEHRGSSGGSVGLVSSRHFD